MADDIICSGFFRAAEGAKLSCLDKFQDSGMLQFISGNILEAFYNFFAALLNPGMWLNPPFYECRIFNAFQSQSR